VGGVTVDTRTYSFDANNNLLTASNVNGTYTMVYDTINRLTSEQEPFGLALTFSYDGASNRTQVQDSFGGVLTSVFDAANRLTTREFGGTGQTPLRVDLAYNSNNQMTTLTRFSDLAGQTTVGYSAYSYDKVQRLTNIQHKNGSGSLLENLTTTYDQAGRVQAETDNGAAVTYSYDAVNEVTGDGTRSYSYDLNGNRNSTGYSTGTGNQLLSDGVSNFTYDGEGNLAKSVNIATSMTWTFAYDNQNHMTGATQRATDGGTLLQQATFLYDALNNRIEKDVYTPTGGTVVTRFGYDGAEVWADLNGSNGLKTRYLRGDVVDQLFARISAGGTAAWYLTDHLGSVRNLTDASGNLQDTVTYDPFGTILTESNSTFGDRYKFTGREFDAETGLQYNLARYYAAADGRWTSQDPLGFEGGDLNVYRYVNNSPICDSDPTGLKYELSYKSVAPPTGGYYGAFYWPILWHVNPTPGQEGIILQKLEIKYSVHVPINRNYVVPQLKTGDLEWFEAWYATKELDGKAGPFGNVNPDAIPIYKEDNITIPEVQKVNDIYFLWAAGRTERGKKTAVYDKTYGYIRFSGTAVFYPCLTEADLRQIGFRNGGYSTGSGFLLSFRLGPQNNEETILNDIRKKAKPDSNIVRRVLTATWDSRKGRDTNVTEGFWI
jgi:RHS repeat-associated protein